MTVGAFEEELFGQHFLVCPYLSETFVEFV
jgi:hypothetical protein